MTEAPEPFDWWHSGRFWYCSLHKPGVGMVSGCGLTKERAISDGHRDLQKLEGKQRLRMSRRPAAQR